MSSFVRHQLLFALVLLSCCLVGLISARWVWQDRLPLTYLNSLYDHSQWQIALSQRIIADDLLYQVAGWRLTQGADPTLINPEVPPLGKYMYGLGWVIFGTPYPITVISLIVAAIGWWLLTNLLPINRQRKLVITALFFTTPILLQQLHQTMLDLFQLGALLWHVWSLISSTRATRLSTQLLYLIISSLALGIFASVKFPLLIPFILLWDCWWLWRHQQLNRLVLLGVGMVSVYACSYSAFFLQNHSVRAWLGAQKWMLSF